MVDTSTEAVTMLLDGVTPGRGGSIRVSAPSQGVTHDTPRSRNGSRACRVLGMGYLVDNVMVKPMDKMNEGDLDQFIVELSVCAIVIVLCVLSVAFLAYAA